MIEPAFEPAPQIWRTARGALPVDRPLLVGILNVTPDSFSDGGRFGTVAAACAHVEALLAAGADLVDVGGESTRPGRTASVSVDEERRRVIPVVEALVRAYPELLLSVDTVNADVARAALDAGAAIVNDVTGFRHDPAMAGTVAAAKAGVILMHSRGTLLELASYRHAEYSVADAKTDAKADVPADAVARAASDASAGRHATTEAVTGKAEAMTGRAEAVTGAVVAELRSALDAGVAAGIAKEAIVVDPGFGFGKTVAQNFQLLQHLAALSALGRPLLVGPSRKRFLGAVTDLPVDRRDHVTAVACALAYERGARLFRVHDVAATREALAIARAVVRPAAQAAAGGR